MYNIHIYNNIPYLCLIIPSKRYKNVTKVRN